jgi:hypothetical protein
MRGAFFFDLQATQIMRGHSMTYASTLDLPDLMHDETFCELLDAIDSLPAEECKSTVRVIDHLILRILVKAHGGRRARVWLDEAIDGIEGEQS